MKFFEKLKGKYDLARWALKRAREAEAQVDELLQLCEVKDAKIESCEKQLQDALEMYCRANAEINKAKQYIDQANKRAECVAEAYAGLKVHADVMRQEIKEYRRRLFEKEQDNAGNDRGE